MEEKIHDLIIIGGGPGGYSAAIYAQRSKLDTILIAEHPGGTAADAHSIENWPGVESKPGMQLMMDFKNHAESYGLKTIMDTVQKIEKKDDVIEVSTSKETYKGKNILLALGLKRRKLNIPGEEELLGRGVSYCATCDAFFYKDKTPAVVGGSDAATMAAILLSEVAKKVYLLYRKDSLRGEQIWIDRVKENPKIEVLYNTEVTHINGENKVQSLSLSTGNELEVDGIFIEIGSVPSTTLIKSAGVKFDDKEYVIVNEKQETNVGGIYAAGDITTGSNKFKQMVTAASEGAIAAQNIYLKIVKERRKE